MYIIIKHSHCFFFSFSTRFSDTCYLALVPDCNLYSNSMQRLLAVNILYARDGKAPSIGQLDYAKLFTVTRAVGTYQTVVSNGPQLPGNLRLFDSSIIPVHLEMPNAVSRIRFPALFVWFGDGMNPAVLSLLNGAGIAAPPADVKQVDLTYKYYPDQSARVSYFIVPAK